MGDYWTTILLLGPKTVSYLPFKKNYFIGEVVVIRFTILPLDRLYNYSKDFRASIA